MALNFHGATPAQVTAVIDHLIATLQQPEGWTPYHALVEAAKQAEPETNLGPAMVAQILGTLSTITWAHGLGYVTVLVRKKDDTIGQGFWDLTGQLHEKVAPIKREEWLDIETRFQHERADAVVRVLRFVRDEVARS